jgi:hypothetical protein
MVVFSSTFACLLMRTSMRARVARLTRERVLTVTIGPRQARVKGFVTPWSVGLLSWHVFGTWPKTSARVGGDYAISHALPSKAEAPTFRLGLRVRSHCKGANQNNASGHGAILIRAVRIGALAQSPT